MALAVKVGKSYVSEAAYSYAKAQAEQDTGSSGILKTLADRFPRLSISAGTSPFSGTGTNNVAISPKILRQMEQDPEKKLEYEALLYDIATMSKPPNTSGRAVKASGFVIGDDGGLRGWGISVGDDGSRRSQSPLQRGDKQNWWSNMLSRPKEKKATPWKASGKEAQEKRLEAHKEKVKKVATEAKEEAKERKAAAALELSEKGKEMLAASQEKNDAPSDGENGTTSTEKPSGRVAINEGKRRRQIAAAATQGDIQQVIAILHQDLQELEDGLKQDMCDEAEVEKAKKLIEHAEQQKAKLPDRAPTPAEQSVMSVNMLI